MTTVTLEQEDFAKIDTMTFGTGIFTNWQSNLIIYALSTDAVQAYIERTELSS